MRLFKYLAALAAIPTVFLLTSVPSFGAVPRSESAAPLVRPSGTSSSGNFGIGVMLGDPSGATAKVWTSRSSAVQIGLAYDFDNFLVVTGDYLWHFDIASVPELHPYVGGGAEIFVSSSNYPVIRGYHNQAELAVRIPLGAEWLPRKAPLGVFAELIPAVGLAPSTFALFQGDVGIRLYL